MPHTPPLLVVDGVWREFAAGDDTVAILKDIHLTIEAGEMVAIVGASGSGKSTLMNILGCLDRPSRGRYYVKGQETRRLSPDELATLRRETFGFIFQRYHLLSDLDALGNAEIPAIYAGLRPDNRRERASRLLARLGLADRLHHRPGQLSGGQQQRVSIARALVNGGEVILADEPTGALDSHSGQEVMAILHELHAEGHTVIMVTHDAGLAEHAERIITLKDGQIVSDAATARDTGKAAPALPATAQAPAGGWRARLDRLREAFVMAGRAMLAHRLRSFLTMLGIIIGIASVVSVVALGEGSRQQILSDISAMGTNTIDIYPGKGFGDRKSSAIHTLNDRDAAALAEQGFVDSVTPGVSTSATLRVGNTALTGQVRGVGQQYFQVKGVRLAEGQAFNAEAVTRYAQEVVIDPNTRQKLFGSGNALGEVILVNNLPVRVIGVTEEQKSVFGNSETLNLWIPYTTAMGRLLGRDYLNSITVRISDSVSTQAAETALVKLMTQRHGTRDFFVMNSDSIRQTVESTTATMTLLVSMIAVISLVVGGIGVMNIMLVSVTERTGEIGVRMAVGARQSDILQQFLIEAVMVCLLGGVLGVGLSLAIGVAFDQFVSNFRMVYSATSIVAAFACSTLIGVLFGYLPARNAARLDPVVALSRD
ncbi:MacB family efflux pump subunit [Laribacter hongkongensis]|uniref:Pyoverdine export ATP-binding/permease protein PvdT n=2 Tax=Laribacter hongkongensis TaxID=168471 RepID=A0ABD4SPC9_9NEIS|nr:MacB family efflux pump subunit [Laribacter hongkongensis]MCG9025580.1 MacB family efflux pump subunit [Laribacter hongkongensis]MCG9101991.1 MacB family efflux pump subunit [Laribacter hongkongensis]MCG9103555.1 MacB family efflux pump subunit [Laribacter hongkongensis]MCG9113846.1 MacB family efflux pump subunit [Laribacter hongkongensis]MCG9118407.1 MacB family efflux pump subunit [Laribacter hongkongensis]